LKFRLETAGLAKLEILKFYNQTSGIDVDVRVTPVSRDILGQSEKIMMSFGNEAER